MPAIIFLKLLFCLQLTELHAYPPPDFSYVKPADCVFLNIYFSDESDSHFSSPALTRQEAPPLYPERVFMG